MIHRPAAAVRRYRSTQTAITAADIAAADDDNDNVPFISRALQLQLPASM